MKGQRNIVRCIDNLTPRELDCLYWCALGFSSKRIANKLAISKGTVDEYLFSAKHKLNAKSRTHAAAILLRARLTTVSPQP